MQNSFFYWRKTRPKYRVKEIKNSVLFNYLNPTHYFGIKKKNELVKTAHLKWQLLFGILLS